MAKSKKPKQSKPDRKAAADERKAVAKAKAKAAAAIARLVGDAKRASKAADRAVDAASRAKGVAVETPIEKEKPTEVGLLRLALRSAEAKLTDAERKIEALEQQIADLHRRDVQEREDAVADAILDAAVAATVEDVVVDAEIAAAVTPTDAETIAEELDQIVSEADAPEEPSHEGEAAAAAAVFEASESADPAEELTPPLPEEPAVTEPSEAWTMLQLRAEARRRGLTGTSNLPKADLLKRLRSS